MNAHLQLFLHIFGAILLFGATAAVAILALAARRRDEHPALARASFWILLTLAIPGWVMMLGFGYWTKSKLHFPDGLGWIDLGAGVADLGLFALLIATGASYAWMRRPSGGWPVTVVGLVTSVYLVALAAAWWAMSAKVPS